MLTIVTLIAAVAFVAAAHKPLRTHSWVFYLLAILIDVFVLASPSLNLARWVRETVVLANVRCLFAFDLFAIVMFVGVLKDGSPLKRTLMPTRAPLSILAAILTLAHVARYAGIYSLRALQNPASLSNGLAASFAVSALLLVLLTALTVTSFNAVKNRLGGRRWKTVQSLSYLFFGLVYLHILLVMARSALMGGANARTAIVIYGVILVLYAALRVLRALERKQERQKRAAGDASRCANTM